MLQSSGGTRPDIFTRLRTLRPALIAIVITLCLPVVLPAQDNDGTSQQQDELPDPDAVPTRALDDAAQEATSNLEAIAGQINLSHERIEQIRAEIEALGGDATRLGAELVAAGQRVDQADNEIRIIEERLEALFASERSIRARLDGHDRSISNLLASLQRISAAPPPALIVDPSDALGSARAAMLLSAVLPQLQTRAETVTTDLADLQQLKDAALAEADLLAANLATLNGERLRIATIIHARTQGLEWLSEDLIREEAEAQALADRASSLEQLIAGLETRIAAVTAADAAHRAASAGQTVPTLDPATLALAFADTERTEPAVPLEAARGFLTAPVLGEHLSTYGASDGYGGITQGMTYLVAPEAQVHAPADGWVAYAGPFLNYGQIVILNAGQNYMIVLAGLARIDVEPDQFVQMGTPIGAMGARSTGQIATSGSANVNGPTLYVELREGGIPIDPAGWWVASPDQEESGSS